MEILNSTESRQNNDEIEYSDYTETFTTNTIFSSREELINWVRAVGVANKIVIIIQRSECCAADGLGNGKTTLTCERSGKYRLSKGGAPRNGGQKITGTKNDVPFRLQANELQNGGWKVHVIDGKHNHELPKYNEGRAIVAKLSKDQLNRIEELTKANVKPKENLSLLKASGVDEKTILKRIYNARQKLKNVNKGGRTVMQQLMQLIVEHNYLQWHRQKPETNDVSYVVFVHPKGIDLLRLFPYVLVIDCTSNTNRYSLPFLEMVGILPTGKNFGIGFAFLNDEKTESYTWTLQCLKEIFDEDKMSDVIVTDRESALLNAITHVFPNSTQILCTRHISKNVEKYVSNMTSDADLVKTFCAKWHKLVDAPTIEDYKQRLQELRESFKNMPGLLNYVHDTWLGPHDTKFVAAYTNKMLHFGTSTSNRVESAHNLLKCWLGSSTGSLDTIWPKIHLLMELQLGEIKGAFQRSQNCDLHIRVLRLMLKGKISHKALKLLYKEYDNMEQQGRKACKCFLRETHGLPCVHEMVKMEDQGLCIQLEDIHQFWKTLHLEGENQSSESENVTLECHLRVRMLHFNKNKSLLFKLHFKQNLNSGEYH